MSAGFPRGEVFVNFPLLQTLFQDGINVPFPVERGEFESLPHPIHRRRLSYRF